jgi:ankyrin repeat protein
LMGALRIIWTLLALAVLAMSLPAAQAQPAGGLDQQLMDAVREGNPLKVNSLIGKGANVRARDEAGNTALHYAERQDIAGMLISAGAAINEKNSDFEMTPLFNAPADLAAFLIAGGADVNIRAAKGMTPLSWAVYWDQERKAQLLIAKGAQVNARDDDGKAALHIAANWGKLSLARILLKNGADINAVDASCWTPLHWAAFEGTEEIILFLVEAGADLTAVSCTPKPETALDVARKYRGAGIAARLGR